MSLTDIYMFQTSISNKFKNNQKVTTLVISLLVGVYGFFLITSTLFEQFRIHHLRFLNNFIIDVHLLLGIGFVYLSIFLARKKRNALIVALIAFAFLLGQGSSELFIHPLKDHLNPSILIRYLILPLLVMILLLLSRASFKVKSDIPAFRNSIKLAVLVLVITLFYGVVGFMLMDRSDFHREISFISALHHTIDQFDLTTSTLHPYTKKAKLFMDSLSFISVISLGYLAVSLFLPVKERLSDQSLQREKVLRLMEKYSAPSEDFFKLWPHDKHYFFSSNEDAAIAYTVRRGVALVLADPVGNKASFKSLFSNFQQMCWSNDWQVSLIHIGQKYTNFYKDIGFQLQLIGQEAIVDINHFIEVTAKNKYFRNIKNRYIRENFTVEILDPPHHQAIVDRLKDISKEWLSKPNRTERGFVMGYFTDNYIQQCRLVIARDAAQTIQAFINLVPSSSFNKHEVTYDMLRATKDAPPNINDFMLYELILSLKQIGLKHLNLGLSPLVGLDEQTEQNSLISSVLGFAYVNGDRFYSFSGLHRFKDKYEPVWSDRYIAYKNGIRGFTKTLNGLLAAMKIRD